MLLRYVIRKNVHKLSLSFRGRETDIQEIKSLISSTRLTVKFYDAEGLITADMYVGDRSSEPLPVIGQEGWYDFSFDLIEY